MRLALHFFLIYESRRSSSVQVAWDDWEVSVTEKNEHHDSKF
jgi:hypothetical protein